MPNVNQQNLEYEDHETEQSYHKLYPSILLSQVLSCTCPMASDQAFANLVVLTSLIHKFEHRTEFEIAINCRSNRFKIWFQLFELPGSSFPSPPLMQSFCPVLSGFGSDSTSIVHHVTPRHRMNVMLQTILAKPSSQRTPAPPPGLRA